MLSYTEPSYDLRLIQKSLSTVKSLRMTLSSRKDAFSLGFDDDEIVSVIQSIAPEDFYKSMPSLKMPDLPNQDVYRVFWNRLYLYIKFQYVNGFLVVSFKLV